MSGALEIAAVGMRAQQRALETIAANVTNINTPAYKRSQVRFSDLVMTPPAAVDGDRAAGNDHVAGVMQWSQPMLDDQGRLQATGSPLDIAIDGAGFIEVLGEQGRTLLWRGGTMRIMPDGSLATASGHALKAGISVPVDAMAMRIDQSGKVFATSGDPATEEEIGRIALVRPGDAGDLTRLDGGLFAIADDATAVAADPGEDGLGLLVQGTLEGSNVDLNDEMVSLLIAQRAYGASAQVVRAADELLSLANGLRR